MMTNRKFGFKSFRKILKLAGVPGYLLLGYYIIQIVFARQKADASAVDGSAVVFASYAMGCGVFCLRDFLTNNFGKKYLWLLMNKTFVKWFLAYTFLCILSCLWSPNLALSAYRGLECIGLLLLNASVVKNLLRYENADVLVLWSVCYALFACVLAFFSTFIHFGVNGGLYAVQFPSTVFFYLAFFFAPAKWIKYPIMIFALFCKSVTGYIGMTLGLCSMMFGNKRNRGFGCAIIVALVVAVSIVGIDGVLNNTIFASKGGDAIENGSFQFDAKQTSGRSEIWGASIEAMAEQERQLYGYGFVAGETAFVQDVIGGQVIGMHNGFLSAYVGTGFGGLLFFSFFMIGYVIMPFNKLIPKKYKSVLISSMFVVLLHTCGNPGLGFRVYGTWMYAMYIVMITCGIYLKYNYPRYFQQKNK